MAIVPERRKVAAIDVGTNATRLTLMEVDAAGVEASHEQHRYPVRLGKDVFAHQEIGPELAQMLVATFAGIARLLDERGVTTYRAVATSAMREAKNAAAVVAEIFAASGLEVEIIAGAQESRLGQVALLRAVGGLHADTLVLDLGGGSLEVARPRGRRGRSLPLGTVRLLALWPALTAPLSGPEFERARRFVSGWVRRHLGRMAPAPMAVGSGGTLEVLARLTGDAHSRVPRLRLVDLTPFAHALAGMDAAARMQIYQLRADRADLVLPAALILLALGECLGLEALVVPGAGLRDGVVHALLMPATPGEASRRLLGGGHEHSALARRSARLAVELFDDLAALHRLWPPALEPLLAAVYAWYLGAHLDPAAAESHAIYLIAQVAPLELAWPARRAAIFALSTLPPAATARPPAWPPAMPLWRPSAAAAAPPGPPSSARRADDGAASGRAGWALAGILRLALTLAPLARRTAALNVDVLADPVRIEADLSVPLTAVTLAPLERALGRRIEVR